MLRTSNFAAHLLGSPAEEYRNIKTTTDGFVLSPRTIENIVHSTVVRSTCYRAYFHT